MKKNILLAILCLAFVSADAKGGVVWKVGRTAAAGYIAYLAHNKISDKIADKVADECYILWTMWRNPNLKRADAQQQANEKQNAFKSSTGIKHESIVRVLITLGAFELSKAILDGYVYESIMG
ncbi:MAG: hypothetical protein WD068_03075 [Candidatus Babeliales bacterium]